MPIRGKGLRPVAAVKDWVTARRFLQDVKDALDSLIGVNGSISKITKKCDKNDSDLKAQNKTIIKLGKALTSLKNKIANTDEPVPVVIYEGVVDSNGFLLEGPAENINTVSTTTGVYKITPIDLDINEKTIVLLSVHGFYDVALDEYFHRYIDYRIIKKIGLDPAVIMVYITEIKDDIKITTNSGTGLVESTKIDRKLVDANFSFRIIPKTN